MKTEKLKGVISNATADPQERAGMLCHCCVCGKTAHCKPRWDFYAEGPGGPLVCEGCIRQGIKAPALIATRDQLINIIAENTRAACAQIAGNIMTREAGKVAKDPRRGPAVEVAEEIRNALLMWPDKVDAWGRKIEVEPQPEAPGLFSE